MNTQIFDNFPVIQLEKVTLRNLISEHDYLDYFNYMNNPEVANYLSQDDLPSNPDLAKIEINYWASLFDRRASIYWAIADSNTNKIIGTCGFNYWNKDQRRSEISYDLDHNYWKKGITTQVVKAISNFASETMQIQRIQATVAIDNIPSIKVLEKSGFIQEGCLKKYGVLNGETKDFYMYALT
jgi:[ribosomal protein S5]-alanine N-acetyltransferase